MGSYVGLGAHSKESVFVIEREDGKEMGRGQVATSPEGLGAMCRRYELSEGTPVALESGTVAFYVARQLLKLKMRPIVIDAREVRVKAHRPRQKTDMRDARELCEGVRRGLYRSIVHLPSPEIELLRQTLSRRRHFVRLKATQINAAKKMLRAAGLRELSSRCLSNPSGWERLREQLCGEPELRGFVKLHWRTWQNAREQVASLEESLHRQSVPFAQDLSRLQTVPGVGPIVGLTAIAAFSDVTRFPSPKHAASYAGLIPQSWQSADSNRQGHITKSGSAELRAMLCEAAHQARRKENPFHPYLVSLTARAGYRKAITAVAHRLCRILFAILRDKAEFDPTRLRVEKGPFTATTTRLYRFKTTGRSRKRTFGN